MLIFTREINVNKVQSTMLMTTNMTSHSLHFDFVLYS